jgi:hydroxypyruvate isomerase
MNDTGRRSFIKKIAGTGAAAITAPALLASAYDNPLPGKDFQPGAEPFRLKYAPSLGMFRGHAGDDPVDNIKFCHDNGFRAVFDNGLMRKPAILQERIADHLQRLDMDLGPFVLYADFSVTSFV